MRFKGIVGAIVLSLIVANPVQAVVKPKVVKMAALPTLVEKAFFQGSGGQWFSTLIAPHSIYLIGTSEPSAGPTQGEVIALDPGNGSQQWDLPIATTTDSIATAATLDSLGNIWIAGSSAAEVETATATPAPTDALNPSGIKIDPVSPTRPGLTQITLWKVSPTGSLLNTYTFNAGTVVEPLTISYLKASLTIEGRNFHVISSRTGNFTNFTKRSFIQPKASTTYTFKNGLYIWKSYLSKSAIPGVVGWKPKLPSPVILKVGSRTGHVYLAYKVLNPLEKIDFLAGVGLVVTTESASGYAISLLK
jgi:outer membrane protein assembly factor BamB